MVTERLVYVKIFTRIFHSPWFLSLSGVSRGVWLQLLVWAKEHHNTSSWKSWRHVGATLGVDHKTAKATIEAFSLDGVVAIQIGDDPVQWYGEEYPDFPTVEEVSKRRLVDNEISTTPMDVVGRPLLTDSPRTPHGLPTDSPRTPHDQSSRKGIWNAQTIQIWVVNFERYQELKGGEEAPRRPRSYNKGVMNLVRQDKIRQEVSPAENPTAKTVRVDASKPLDNPYMSALPKGEIEMTVIAAGQMLMAMWNHLCPLNPKVTKLTGTRLGHIAARLRDLPDLAEWEKLFKRINDSLFLTGRKRNAGSWRAGFDWLLKPSNFTKVLEGNYDDNRRTEAEYKTGDATL